MNTNRTIQKIKNQPFMTYLFLGIQIFLFLLMTIDGGSENGYTLLKYGAKYGPSIAAGEWWRFIMPMFLHIGALHLIVNSVTLYFLGTQLEGVFGHTRFTIIYLLSGIAGNVASFAFSPSLSAGASTSLFGLFGCYLMLAQTFKGSPMIQAMAKNFMILIVLNLVTGILSSGVDNYGHVGGLIGGFLIAVAVSVPRKIPGLTGKRIVALLGYLVAIAILIYGGYNRY